MSQEGVTSLGLRVPFIGWPPWRLDDLGLEPRLGPSQIPVAARTEEGLETLSNTTHGGAHPGSKKSEKTYLDVDKTHIGCQT